MKNLKLAILLLLSPLTLFAQLTESNGQLTGLWTGVLSNDSASIRQDQSFEIALTEYRGKVYGYSRSTFIVNDTLYYIVKRVKGTIDGNTCEVKDEEIVSCNFQKKLEKGVKVIHTFRLNESDSTWELDGNWKTTQTKKYYSVSGKSDLSEEKDIDKSKIFPHLEELNLAKEVPFYVEARKVKDAIVAQQLEEQRVQATRIRPEAQSGINRPANDSKPLAVKTNTIAVSHEVVTLDERAPKTNVTTEQQSALNKSFANKPAGTVKTNTVPVTNEIVTLDEPAPKTTLSPEQQAAINKGVANKPTTSTVKTSTVAVNNKIVVPEAQKPVVASQPVKQPVLTNKPVAAPPTNTGTSSVNVTPKPEEKKPQAIIEKPAPVVTAVAEVPAPINIAKINAVNDPSGAARQINERKTDAQQTVEFKSDSLVIAVYDNGEIDGDTVSVLLNGEVVMAKQGLKASAAKKTLYLSAVNKEDLTLVLYAENLGKYPPNTGLLVIYDGEDRHYVRFSADLQKNAGVVLRRKK